MPPVTPSAISATSLLGVGVDFLDLLRDDFFLGDRGLLAIACRDARNGPVQQLTGAGTGGDDELERVGKLAAINHINRSIRRFSDVVIGFGDITNRPSHQIFQLDYFTLRFGLVPASSRAPPSRR